MATFPSPLARRSHDVLEADISRINVEKNKMSDIILKKNFAVKISLCTATRQTKKML